VKHAILMGDPSHFSVVGGANPHTRDRYGRRKTVDRALAIQQWKRMRDRLQEQGFHVEVIPPDPKFPGLVYPANFGFRHGDHYVLSNLTPTRRGEQPAYRKALEGLGLRCATIRSSFEGEADLFPAGGRLLFTHGTIEKQRFVFRFGWPPYKRVYGFRSDPIALAEIAALEPFARPVEKLRLVDERYYHGDTCLCSFGPGRRELLAYLPVLAPEAVARLRELFPDLVEIDDADAAIYAANSFAFERNGEHFLLVPEGISARLESRIQERGVRVLKADVSEFHKKGGGSVKCMIGDLGAI
jgi:N-dimethylarginine dimethylaminohydrolase